MTTYLRPAFAADIVASEIFARDYHIALVALGYERRSSHLATLLEGKIGSRFAIPFEADRVLAYEENKAQLANLGFKVIDIREREVLDWWQKTLNAADGESDTVRVCVDISSLTRSRLAGLLEGLVSTYTHKTFEVDFVYTVAEFSPPPNASEKATVCGVVSPFLAGWPSDPDLPVAAIIGLGYELEKAVGAIEYLEPAKKVLISPISKDRRFDREVKIANEDLLHEEGGSEAFYYPIDRPTQCLELLDALIHGMRDEARVITIPFGPKIFALCCMLMACRYYPEVGVWRISAETARAPKDQVASETTIGLRVRFEARSQGAALED